MIPEPREEMGAVEMPHLGLSVLQSHILYPLASCGSVLIAICCK